MPWCHLRDELADQVVRDMLDVAEADTALAHVQFRRHLGGVGFLEPAEQFRVAIDAHMIHGDMVLLGDDAQERERSARRDVIPGWIRRQRDDIMDAVPVGRLLEPGR